jgi:hypothetical protein
MYKVTFVKKIVDGDVVYLEDTRMHVEKVQKARGRKPKKGENIYLFTDQGRITLNSLRPIRVWRGA